MCSGYCSTYYPFILETGKRGDFTALEMLDRELALMSSIPEVDKIHLRSLIAAAQRTVVQPARGELPAGERFDIRMKMAAEKNRALAAVPTALVAPEPAVAAQPVAALESDLESADIPQGESTFDNSRRIILFALPRKDVIAVDKLESNLESLTGLSDVERTALIKMIVAFRSKVEGAAGPGFALVTPAVPALALVAPAGAGVAAAAPIDNSSATGEANRTFRLPSEAEAVFSKDYLRIRQRYLDFFFFNGLTSSELDVTLTDGKVVLTVDKVTKATFADQTLSMGQAMLTFAGEANLLKNKGISPAASEAAIKMLLDTFERLDAADQKLYGASKAGFFVRDDIHEGDKMGVPWPIKSDMNDSLPNGDPQDAMSLDQTTSLFVGWWAISRWSTDPDNANLAREQIDRVMSFLMDSKFVIRLPNGGGIKSSRGPDFRYAAGFLCRIAELTTGNLYFADAKIDVSIKGDPVRIRDDNLGEFELPGFRIPADMPAVLSHNALLALGGPAAIVALTAPPKVKISVSDLFPDSDDQINLPCAHLTAQHPGGDTSKIVCIHMTAKHPGGDPGPNLPCTHVVKVHPNGDNSPCIHMTAKHPGGDNGPTLPCTHIKKLHDHDTVEKTIKIGGFKKKVKTDVPCTHFGPEHPGGHETKIPCVHLVPAHPGGHTVTCVHTKLEHPGGHPSTIPCVHLVKQHPDGHEVTVPCFHLVPAHPGGHGFDLNKLTVEIPLGDKLHSFARHIALQCLAFEPTVNGPLEVFPAAIQSDHVWSALLRNQVIGDIPAQLTASKAHQDRAAIPNVDGPTNIGTGSWVRPNRWERCTDLTPDGGGSFAYSGIDYLSLEVLMRLNGISE